MNEEDNKFKILIVDDEKNTRDALGRLLRQDYSVTIAEDGIRGVNLIKNRDFDIIITDLKMPGADGLEVIAQAIKKNPLCRCLVVTAYGSIENAVEAMKNGAFDFLEKPLNLERVELIVKRAAESKSLADENKKLKDIISRRFGPEDIIGQSDSVRTVIETVKQVAPSRATVLITGESGTGKELVAQSIHNLSGRKGQFIALHCAALPSSLLESELFGHEKGSFTGASEKRKGRFELADGGTLFLDEISEIDLSVQVKILRILETRTFERVGGTESLSTDARVIAATNKDLKMLVEEGKFREDLYYRLEVIKIHVPPLRDRREDIPLLAKHFLDVFVKENGKNIKGISEKALDALTSYDWPGNIRQLKNCIERMVVLSNRDYIDVANLSPEVRGNFQEPREAASTSKLDIVENENILIRKALSKSGNNISKAADLLGISRRTLHRKIKKIRDIS